MHHESRKSPCVFARGGLGDGEGNCASLKRVFVQQDGQVVAVDVCVVTCGTCSPASWRIIAWKLPQVALRICVGRLRAGPGFNWSTERRHFVVHEITNRIIGRARGCRAVTWRSTVGNGLGNDSKTVLDAAWV